MSISNAVTKFFRRRATSTLEWLSLVRLVVLFWQLLQRGAPADQSIRVTRSRVHLNPHRQVAEMGWMIDGRTFQVQTI